MTKQLEFYFPKTKSKHMAMPTKGKVYPSKGGTVRYGVQASMNGSMSLPKYVKEEEFEYFGFGKINPSYKYPQEFIDAHYHMDSNPMLTGDDSNETVELAYQAWYQKQAENEVLNAEVTVGEVQVKSRKDYDVGNELSGFSNMEVGDIDLEDYEDQITESVEDEVIEAIRESVNDNMPISDGDSETSHVNVDTELEITVPISGDIDFDWTVNENYHEEVEDSDWNAETLDFHGENYQNHLKVVNNASYSRKYAESFNAECEHCEGEMTTNHKQKCVNHKICKMCLKEFGACPICDLKRTMKKHGYLDAESVGSPSPSSPLEEVPATVPSPAEPTNESFNAEMDELDDTSSIIRNQVGDMVGMVELDENDEDIEKVDIDIIDDDGEMAYEGTLGAEAEYKPCNNCEQMRMIDEFTLSNDSHTTMNQSEVCDYCFGDLDFDGETFESQGKNTKMILGITALAVGLGLWKGKEIMSISDKISQSIKNMRK